MILYGLTDDEYAAIPAVRRSDLVDHGTPNPLSLLIGKAFHTLVLEPDMFDKRFRVVDLDRRGTKAWKAEEGECLKRVEFHRLQLMATSARAAIRKRGIQEGLPEVSVTWDDVVPCKARPDLLTPVYALDLKSCWRHQAFIDAVPKCGYDMQAAMDIEGLKANGEPRRVLFVVTEKSDPFETLIFAPRAETISRATASYRALLEGRRASAL